MQSRGGPLRPGGMRGLPRYGVVVGALALALIGCGSPEVEESSADAAAAMESPAAESDGDGKTVDSDKEKADKTESSTPSDDDPSHEGGSDGQKRSSAGSKDGKSSSTKLYRVIRVVDGDTVKVDINGGESVRVIGIDTPETVHPDEPVECGGPEASAAAKELLSGRRVAVIFDESQGRRDKYDRLLAYLDIPDVGDFGNAMLRAGHAEEYTYDTAYERRPTYLAAERKARNSGKASWGSCAQAPEPAPYTPPAEPDPTPTPEPAPAPAPAQVPEPAPAPAPPPPAPASPGPGWTNDALTPGYTGCRQGYPGGRIDGVYWWKPISC